MALSNGYGVVIGTKHNYYRDNPDDFGRYYHGNLEIAAPAGIYRCAIDVDPKSMPDGIQWRVVKIRPSDFANIASKGNGWHALSSAPGTGALDYIRAPALHPPLLFKQVWFRRPLYFFLHWLRWNPPWNNGTGIQALESLESVINGGVRFFVFGEPFSSGLGVHNIHQNQGDPINSPFSAENAIWQDGGTIVQMADGSFVGFLNKFKTQSFKTDAQGRPA